ncbi:MAG: diguanylate cyclase [Leptospirales bacterium]|nr:diguanylate cyclase [Leptospirales bacterium]
MDHILIVEDSESIAALLAERCERQLGLQAQIAPSVAALQTMLATSEHRYFAAICDLNLPDAPPGAAVDLLRSKDIPIVVLTGEWSEEIRSRIWERRVADYVLKESSADISYALNVVRRLRYNPQVAALVADPLQSNREAIADILRDQKLKVLQCESPEEALQYIESRPDLRLALIDYGIGGDRGLDLTTRIRRRRKRDSLAIIALTDFELKRASARFLRSGANDVLARPFTPEELLCRINLHLDTLDLLEQLRSEAEQDFLTGLGNRHYLNERATAVYADCLSRGMPFALAMADIDHFKSINDRFGHLVGDRALKHLGRILSANTKGKDVVARIGGEEFVILLPDTLPESAARFFESLRREIAGSAIDTDSGTLAFTVSFGVATNAGASLREGLERADRLLYRAKASGRNRVVTDLTG